MSLPTCGTTPMRSPSFSTRRTPTAVQQCAHACRMSKHGSGSTMVRSRAPNGPFPTPLPHRAIRHQQLLRGHAAATTCTFSIPVAPQECLKASCGAKTMSSLASTHHRSVRFLHSKITRHLLHASASLVRSTCQRLRSCTAPAHSMQCGTCA